MNNKEGLHDYCQLLRRGLWADTTDSLARMNQLNLLKNVQFARQEKELLELGLLGMRIHLFLLAHRKKG